MSISATVVDILVTKVVASISATAIDIYYIVVGRVVVVVNHCFTSLFGTKGLLSDIVIR